MSDCSAEPTAADIDAALAIVAGYVADGRTVFLPIFLRLEAEAEARRGADAAVARARALAARMAA